MVKAMLSKPEVLQSLLMANPQVREMCEKNPEVKKMLSDPEVLKQASHHKGTYSTIRAHSH